MWRKVLWSDETKMELFGHCYVWKEKVEVCKLKYTIKTVKHKGVTVSCHGGALRQKGLALHRTDGIMKKEDYVAMLKQHLKISDVTLKLGLPHE